MCSDALCAQGLSYLNALDAPAMFTSGDNDWTDCDRPADGGFDSLERLDYERQLYFATPYSFGRHRILQEVQTDPTCLGVAGPAPCIENRRWSVQGFTYATINVQGSCNNLCDTAPNVHGDSHYFHVDKPLLDSQGRRLENFTRVETFGDNQGNSNNDVHWVKALVDPHSHEVFAFQAQIVPANRSAVPAP